MRPAPAPPTMTASPSTPPSTATVTAAAGAVVVRASTATTTLDPASTASRVDTAVDSPTNAWAGIPSCAATPAGHGGGPLNWTVAPAARYVTAATGCSGVASSHPMGSARSV